MKFVDKDDGRLCRKCESRKERILENGMVICLTCRHLKVVKSRSQYSFPRLEDKPELTASTNLTIPTKHCA